MSNLYLYIGMGSIIFIIIGFCLFFYIKSQYKKYDEIETLKDHIVEWRVNIKKALDHFRLTYDPNVYNHIKLNVDFCIQLILKKDFNNQVLFLEKLFNTLFETGYRLKTKYDDVVYIIAPLKNLREELVIELTDYIKENSEGLE